MCCCKCDLRCELDRNSPRCSWPWGGRARRVRCSGSGRWVQGYGHGHLMTYSYRKYYGQIDNNQLI